MPPPRNRPQRPPWLWLQAANPAVRALEAAIEDGFTADQIATIKTWLVEAAKRL